MSIPVFFYQTHVPAVWVKNGDFTLHSGSRALLYGTTCTWLCLQVFSCILEYPMRWQSDKSCCLLGGWCWCPIQALLCKRVKKNAGVPMHLIGVLQGGRGCMHRWRASWIFGKSKLLLSGFYYVGVSDTSSFIEAFQNGWYWVWETGSPRCIKNQVWIWLGATNNWEPDEIPDRQPGLATHLSAELQARDDSSSTFAWLPQRSSMDIFLPSVRSLRSSPSNGNVAKRFEPVTYFWKLGNITTFCLLSCQHRGQSFLINNYTNHSCLACCNGVQGHFFKQGFCCTSFILVLYGV